MGDRIVPNIRGLGVYEWRWAAWGWGIILGLVMPIATALLYPTYHVMMERPSYEITRILEMPYVLFEIGFILWAGRRGFDFPAEAMALPRDIKFAGAIFISAMFASSLVLSTNVPMALTQSLMWLVHIIFALAVLRFFRQESASDPEGFIAWHVLGLIVLALYTWWWFSFPPPVQELPFGEIRWRGALPGFIDVRHFGSWTGAIASGLAVRILYGADGRGLVAARLFYALAAGLTLWSGTRAAILAIIVVTLVFIAMQRRLPSPRRIAWAFALTLAACAGAYLAMFDDIAFKLIVFDELASTEDLTATRSIMWGRTVDLWLQSPWLGLGTGSIFWEYGPDKNPTQPHNVILQFLLSWGVVGAAAALWIIGRALVLVHRRGRAIPAIFAILGFTYALLFQSLLEGMLHYPRFIVSIIVMGALIYHFDPRATDDDRTAEPAR